LLARQPQRNCHPRFSRGHRTWPAHRRHLRAGRPASIHRFKADEAYLVGEGKGPVGAYLDIRSIIALAKEKGVDMIHPGLRIFVRERRVRQGLRRKRASRSSVRAELLRKMGDKTAARAVAQKVGVPTLPGTEDPIEDRGEALKTAKEIGFPLIIKAAFGGGGRGMRVVQRRATSRLAR
jgi:pyruvate carboxylase